MTRLITIALLSLVLAACDTVVIPPQAAPVGDHKMDCRTLEFSGMTVDECKTGTAGSRGEL